MVLADKKKINMILFLKIILYTAQGAALLAAIAKWNENKHSSQRYFLHFMIFVAVVEIAANLSRMYTSLGNSYIYNIYIIVSFLFFFYWFYAILKYKKVFYWILGIYFISVGISISLESFVNEMLHITLYMGTLLILFLTSLYYRSLLEKKEVVDFLKLQPFWIATGLLIFYIGLLPVQFLQGFKDFDRINYQFIMMVLNIFLYGCFAIAFLCPQKK